MMTTMTRLRVLRTQRGFWNGTNFAKELGIPATRFLLAEAGRPYRRLRGDEPVKVAEALNVEADWLFDEKGYPLPLDPVA